MSTDKDGFILLLDGVFPSPFFFGEDLFHLAVVLFFGVEAEIEVDAGIIVFGYSAKCPTDDDVVFVSHGAGPHLDDSVRIVQYFRIAKELRKGRN